jgi:acetolactate synthase-1/2/3 large subunit
VFPLYDAAVKADRPMPIIDVRHEQTAVFAAEATGKLTRRPGFAVLTAGPGVTNGMSAVATAHFNASPLVVLGGRAALSGWGRGSLQELDHPPLLAGITKWAFTVAAKDEIADGVDAAFRLAGAPHRGPVFLDVHLDHLFDSAPFEVPGTATVNNGPPDVGEIADLLARAERPVFVYGSDVWMNGAEGAARLVAEELGVPVVTNGMGRGVLPSGHELLVSRARSRAFREADLVMVVGTPLDFRLGYGVFGSADVVHVVDAADQVAAHTPLAASYAGDLRAFFAGLSGEPGRYAAWRSSLAETARAAIAADEPLLTSVADPIHPLRIYGELNRLLDPGAVVIGDGGDFVSYAGKYVEPRVPGRWLDPGPYGCLGTGMGYAAAARLAHPAEQVVLLLGDGAAGLSLMDVDTLVRHRLPVVIICGNNDGWGLERIPMRQLYGYDVAAELGRRTRYDEVVAALGGAGELVTRPGDIGPALRRAFAADVPYLVNVSTDPEVAYPRNTTGV